MKNDNLKPLFIFVIGNRGAGKSFLAKKIQKNSNKEMILICADEIHSKILGYDRCSCQGLEKGTVYFPKDFQAEGTKKVNELLLKNIKERKNIILDASFSKNHKKFIKQIKDFGYDVEVQGIVVNKYVAAYNVEKRIVDFFDECENVKLGLKKEPENFNAVDVGYKKVLEQNDKIADIIEEIEKWGVKLFLFVYKKENPEYVSENGKCIIGKSKNGVDFYYDNQETDYSILYSKILKLEKRSKKYNRDILGLKKETSILAAEQRKISFKKVYKKDGCGIN